MRRDYNKNSTPAYRGLLRKRPTTQYAQREQYVLCPGMQRPTTLATHEKGRGEGGGGEVGGGEAPKLGEPYAERVGAEKPLVGTPAQQPRATP